jgi:DNA-binding transcriptional LysR family regulator
MKGSSGGLTEKVSYAKLRRKMTNAPNQTAKMRSLEWSDLRVVLAVARSKTLRASAVSLRVNQSTVSRRVAALETALGVRLFERLEGAMTATRAGEAVIDEAERIEHHILSIQERVANQDAVIAGSVRLTTVSTIANHILIPAMSQLRSRHPALCLELISDNTNLSITRREADIALRFARPSKDDAMLCQRIGEIEYAVFTVAGASPDDLPWLTYEDSANVPQARWIAASRRNEEPIPLLVNDGEAILHAVRSGLGKSLLPVFLQDRFDDLQFLPRYGIVLSREVWLIVHPQIRRLARIQSVMTWLTSAVLALSEANRQQQTPIRQSSRP